MYEIDAKSEGSGDGNNKSEVVKTRPIAKPTASIRLMTVISLNFLILSIG